MAKIYKSSAGIEKDFFPSLYKERCPECEQRARKEDLHCHECGALLDPDRPGVVSMVMKDYCKRCGHPNECFYRHCTQCGNGMEVTDG